MASSDRDHHWVEDLFPPAFGLTVDEILEGNFGDVVPGDTKNGSTEPEADGAPSVFEQVGKSFK